MPKQVLNAVPHAQEIQILAAAQHGVILATQLAEMLGVGPRTIQQRAQVIPGVVLAGRVYLLTAAEAQQISAEISAPGKRGPKTQTPLH